MISDGVLPSNEGRATSCALLRRAAARQAPGVNEPFLYEVCATVVHENQGHYPTGGEAGLYHQGQSGWRRKLRQDIDGA